MSLTTNSRCNASWNEDILRLELAALREEDFDLDIIGFDDQELARLLAEQDAGEGLTDEDAVPALPEIPVSATGDLWILGNHKLYVGDATNQAAVARLMAGDAADLVFTDPPYNVDYEGYTEDKLKIRGDRMTPEEFQAIPAFDLHQLPLDRKARRLIVRLPFVFLATRISKCTGRGRIRGPLPDHLGEEHVRLGLRTL